MSFPAVREHMYAQYMIEMIPSIGPAIPADPDTDPGSIMNATTGLSMTKDYEPNYLFRRIVIDGGLGAQVGATLKVIYANGGIKTWTFDVVAKSVVIFEDAFKGIYASGTTATAIFPFF
jgi:hypothetical protein